jgi:hypothetical protein
MLSVCPPVASFPLYVGLFILPCSSCFSVKSPSSVCLLVFYPVFVPSSSCSRPSCLYWEEKVVAAMAGACSRCTVLVAGAGGGAQRWKEELKLVLLSSGVCRSGEERVAGARLITVRGEVGCLYCVCWESKLICIPSQEVPSSSFFKE